jgi:hypothetical protein
MLLHQVIVLVAAWSKRFDAVLLNAVAVARRVASRARLGGSDLQET